MSRLCLAIGLASATGRRADNQDFCAALPTDPAMIARNGAAAVLADGVSGAMGGRIAAELACRSFLDAYFEQPRTLGVAACAHRALAPFNRWLHAMGRTDPALQGAATTIAIVLVHGRTAHALHVGDSRVWHLRGGTLTLLTADHTLDRPGQRHVLVRAVGLEPALRLDHQVQALAVHDRLLLTSDGVHAVLGHRSLARLLDARTAPSRDAQAIVQAALDAGSTDNATALVLDVLALPPPDRAGIAAQAAGLSLGLRPPALGDSVDGFRLTRLISDSRASRLFVAAGPDGPCVLKFPKAAALSNGAARAAFTRETLIGAQVHSAHVAAVRALPADRQTRLYVALALQDGQTLESLLAQRLPGWPAALGIAAGLCRGVAALHRLAIIHRDIKPENVMVAPDLHPRLLDLGSALLPMLPDEVGADIPGTASFMAPELYEGCAGNAATDQFALGVTLYRLFTGHYPYGEIEPFSRPRYGRALFQRPADPTTLRPELPPWLAACLMRTVAVDAAARYSDVLELLAELEQGHASAQPRPRPQPLIERHPVRFWQGACGVLAAALAAALWLR